VELELTHHATEDLRAISRYTLSKWDEEQEERYLRGIYSKFNEISTDPAQWRFRNDLFPQCQIARFGRHVILFIFEDDGLTIVRVLHGAMEFKNHVPDVF
jgi:toxin ParE1/3/4